MYKLFVFAVCGGFMLRSGVAQDNLESILRQVEQNNTELLALKAKMESEKLSLKSSNNLPDPEFGMFYLPFGDHTAGDYTEYQVTQTVEFPSVYGARNQLIKTQSGQIEFAYAERRQELLVEAKKYFLELIYLEKRLSIEQERIAQLKELLEQAQERYEEEQISILELNKTKVAWMQERYHVEHIQNDKVNALRSLQTLNGGTEIQTNSSEYVLALDLPSVEILWNEKLANDPTIGLLKQQESIAMQQLKLSKSKSLPNLTAGFNSQGVAGERFSGIYAGLSIPLWSNKNRVKSAQSNLNYQEAFVETKTQMAFTEFEREYNNYQHKLERFRTYQETLDGLDSEALLLESYQLGEISFLEYYQELQFFRDAMDTMLDMQHQLHQANNKLLKHQL